MDQKNCVTFNEALTAAKFGRFNYFLITITAVILTAGLIECLGIGYVVAVADCDLELTTGDKGIISGVAYLGIIAGSHLWGFLADTQGRRKVMIPTLLISATCSILSSFMPNFWSITVFRFLTGFFMSGSSATIYVYIGEFHSSRTSPKAIMAAAGLYSALSLSFPLFAYLIINQEWKLDMPLIDIVYRPWRLFLVFCAVPSLLGALSLLWLPESPKYILNQESSSTQTIAIVEKVHRINSGSKAASLGFQKIVHDNPEEQQSQAYLKHTNGVLGFLKLVWNQTAPLFMKPYLWKTLLVCTLQFGTFYTGQGSFMFFPGIFNALVKATDAGVERTTVCEAISAGVSFNQTQQIVCSPMLEIETYGLNFALEIAYTLGFVVITFIINRVTPSHILVFVYLCCGASALALTALNIPYVIMALYMIMLLPGFNISVASSITVDLFPTNLRAMAVGISLMFGRLGSVFGSNITGFLLDDHCELTYALSGGMLIFCAVLAFFCPKSSKPEQTSQEK
ncbi:synaptic vesicle glycoprotein 2B-like [Uranotaenia lowii]|uniref:synaptic vesicle glycoprotein 2B-like n=1 Tax=Uranotaenia lowii TaxID=190385 RepID=UPI002479A741|nr:synaptic vesicle glycoprotein 2B-like [Uranotaenia lowii]